MLPPSPFPLLARVVPLYNGGVSEAAARVIVVAGALMQPLWVPPAEVSSRLQRLSAMADLQVTDTQGDTRPGSPEALPRELAHDRWLRSQPALQGAAIAPGAMMAVRRVARFDRTRSGWLVEPAHFHLAQDHLVLLAGAVDDLAEDQARALAEAIAPLLAEESLTLAVLGPTTWLLTAAESPLHVRSAASEAAAGRNVHGYLPTGEDARRYRKLLNEIQMTWHEHADQPAARSRRAAAGEQHLAERPRRAGSARGLERCKHRRALPARRDASRCPPARRPVRPGSTRLQAMDARLADLLSSANPPGILLCGDRECRWLQRPASATGSNRGRPVGVLAALARRLGAFLGGGLDSGGKPRSAKTSDGLAALFTEGEGAVY